MSKQHLVIIGLIFVLVAAPAVAQDSSAERESDPATETAEDPGGPGNNSIEKPETLPHRSGYDRRSDFGSTANTVTQLEEDDRVKKPAIRFPKIDQALDGWYETKRRLNEKLGIQFSFDYNTLYQKASDSLSDQDKAWSGVFRILGKWELVKRGQRNAGELVFGFESRHDIGGYVPPSDLAGELGYLGVTGTLFNGSDAILGNLYYQQPFLADRRGGIMVGRFDPNDFMDVLGYANPWSTFSNLAVLLNPSIAFPDWSWGAGAGAWLNEGNTWYALGTINDANGTITNESFFDGGAEFFKQVEVGWTPERDQRMFTKVHVMAWHVDDREDAGIESAHGFTLGANRTWRQRWMAWVRGGWSDGAAPIYNETLSIGFGGLLREWSDVFGIGLNWGDAPDDSLREQWTAEMFYRLQLSQNLQLTPSLQWLGDPALNEPTDSILVLGLRMRLTL